jgi:hypothetical protein
VRSQIDHLLFLPSTLTYQDKWEILTCTLQLKPEHLTHTLPWHLAAPPLQAHADDHPHAAPTIFGQPDPSADGLNPDTVYMQLHLPLPAAGFGLCYFPL